MYPLSELRAHLFNSLSLPARGRMIDTAIKDDEISCRSMSFSILYIFIYILCVCLRFPVLMMHSVSPFAFRLKTCTDELANSSNNSTYVAGKKKLFVNQLAFYYYLLSDSISPRNRLFSFNIYL